MIDVNAQTLNGWTALTRAVYRGHSDVVLQLVQSGRELDLDARSEGGTALHWALERRYLDIADMLIAQPSVDVNQKDEDGFTPFVAAAKYTFSDIVRALLQDRKDLDVNAKDGQGVTALGWAARLNDHDTIKVLLVHPGVDVNVPATYSEPVLHTVIDSGDVGTIRLLLERLDLDINALNYSGESAIFLAITREEHDVARLILESRNDLNTNLEYNIMALPDGKVGRFFPENPESDQRRLHRWTILHLAAGLGYSEILRLLLERFVDTLNVNARLAAGDTALHCALIGENMDVLEILLDSTDIDIDATNEDGMTALHLAADSGNLNVVRLLLEHRADMDITEKGGFTAEQLATSSGHTEVAEFLRSGRRVQPIDPEKTI
ncbi:ankyrin repeat-containing domain protein [Aspergillus keveii]|uniref:Ankyrin repeat-containing domain protein n=1 Tax=Aspergillus keveii TaxID=714993 RepID=A0ABR4G2H1_9EURO